MDIWCMHLYSYVLKRTTQWLDIGFQANFKGIDIFLNVTQNCGCIIYEIFQFKFSKYFNT